MENNKIEFLESTIDTSRFGFKVAKINDKQFLTKEIFQELKKNDFKLIISRIPGEDLQTINFMEANGFHLKDVQLTYKFDLMKNQIDYEYFNEQIVVREATAEDIDSLKEIAAECFWNYGHYFADDKLDKENCIEVYKDWTARAVVDKSVAEKFFLAEFQGQILGYLFFVMKENDKGKFSSSGLGAVASTGRSQNIFSTLAISSLEWAKSEGQIWQEHNVLNINYPVNRVFSKVGMSVYKSELTFHAWL
jgi:hypothetical protein